MPRYAKFQDEKLRLLDEPQQVVEPGGLNGRATIKGLPTRSDAAATGLRRDGRRVGVMAEPVAVLLRDAVTIDTAVRLTGADRATLQNAAVRGYLPCLKLGSATSPYLVRLRDVLSYLARMSAWKQTRGQFVAGESFIGFEPWLVERVAQAYPEAAGQAVHGTPYAHEVKKPERGGRPPGAPNRATVEALEGSSAAGAKKPAAQKPKRRRSNHAPSAEAVAAAIMAAAVRPVPKLPKGLDPTKLPKWHPLWRRPGTE